MTSYFAAMVLLSGGAFIHSKSDAPELRPADPRSDQAWRWLGKASFFAWIFLLGWGFWTLHWSQPLAGLLFSLGFNGFIAMRGPRPTWPLLSMLFCGLGLLSAAFLVWG